MQKRKRRLISISYKSIIWATISVLLLFISLEGKAQNTEAILTPKKIRIAEPSNLEFRIKIPKGAVLIEPMWGDTISGKIEITANLGLDTIPQAIEKEILLSRKLKVTSYEAGFFPVPPMAFGYISGMDTIYLESQALLMEVDSVQIDPQAPIKDIKEIQKAPILFEDILPWLLGFIALLIISFVAYYIYRRRKYRKPLFVPRQKPQIPPYIIAINELEHLRKKKLCQQGFVKVYHIGLTDIVRTYIQSQFNIPSMEMTTDETLAAIKPHIIEKESLSDLEAILCLADLVKFAKHLPEERENDLSLDLAIKFVKNTIPVEASNQQNNDGPVQEDNDDEHEDEIQS